MSYRDNLLLSICIAILITLTAWGSQTSKSPERVPKKPLPPTQHSNADTALPEPTPSIANTKDTPNISEQKDLYRVIRVIDGDTFIIEGGQSVRMIGMNTPELFPRDGSVKDCYAEEATAHTISLIFQKEVRLEKDISNTDKYGRLLRYVYVGDILVNHSLVAGGFARVRAYKPDVKHHTDLLKAMNIAAQEKRGLWGACN